MNILEKMKAILSDCELMDTFNNGEHVDYTDKSLVNNYGLYSSGDSIVRKTIVGDMVHSHKFTIYTILDTFDDVDRTKNVTFLLDLANYLNTLHVEPFQDDDKWITIESFTPSNGMLMEPLEDRKAVYQFQLNVTYKESEEL